MKRILIAIAGIAMILTGTNAFAQGKYGADSAECIKYLSYYQDYYKQRNYDDAIPNWRTAYKLCPPTASQNLILNGTTLVRTLIQRNANNPQYVAGLVDTLLTLHDVRAQYYPSYAVTALNNKAIDMNNYVKDPKVLYNGLKEVIAANKENVDPKALLFQLNAAIEMFKNGDMGAEDIINTYNDNISLLEKIPGKNDEEKAENAQLKTDIETVFISSKVASCETLLEQGAPKKPGLDDLLEYLHDLVLPMAVASASPKDVILNNLRTAGLERYFDVLVSGEDLDRGKPDPLIFLETSERLGTRPAKTLVLEDSANGVTAAHRGGFMCVMVPDLERPSAEVAAMTSAVVDSLDQVIDLMESGSFG